MVLAWLEEEFNESGEGFYCNRETIIGAFNDRDALCAVLDDSVVAFTVFTVSPPRSVLYIVEVHPKLRRRGFAKQVVNATVQYLHRRGAQYVEARCTSREGAALCRSLGFVPHIDARNGNSWSRYRHGEYRLFLEGLPQIN